MREHLTPERKAKIREDFKEFLRSFTTSSEEGKPKRKYERKVEEMAFDEGKHDLVMDYSDLTLFSTEMVEELFSYPKEILNEFNTALEEEVERKNPDLEPSEVRKHRVRLKGFRREKDIRSLFGSEYIGELVSLNGVVAKATRVRPRLKKAMFRCKKCTHTFAYEIPTTYQEPRNCPAANCSNTNSFRMVEELEYEKFQILWVQEPLGRIPPGELPKSIPVRVRGDMTGEVRPGERITVYGILDSTPKDRLRKGDLPLYDTFVESTYIEGEEKESEVKLTADEKERIKDLKEDPELEEKVVGSIAPSIQGFENVKKAIAVALFEGTPKELGEGTRVRHTINVFLVGDPGTGKSRILRHASQVAPRGLYTSGKGSSAAGLTAATVKTDSGWGLEAGALVLADKGTACLHPDTRVIANNRFVRISDLFEEENSYPAKSNNENVRISERCDKVISLDKEKLEGVTSSSTRVRRKHYDGKMLEIKLRSGFELKVTPDHKLIDGDMKWKKAKDFSEGEKVIAPFNLKGHSNESYLLDIVPEDWLVCLSKREKEEIKGHVKRNYDTLSEFNHEHGLRRGVLSGRLQMKVGKFKKILKDLGIYKEWRTKKLSYGRSRGGQRLEVAKITPETCYILGFAYGDGHVRINKKHSEIEITQSSSHERQIDRLKEFYDRVTGKELALYEREGGRKDIKISSNLMAYLYVYLVKDNLQNLLRLNNECLKGFLAGVIDSDGCVSIKNYHDGRYKVAHINIQVSENIKENRTLALALRSLGGYARIKPTGEGKSHILLLTDRRSVRNINKELREYSVKTKQIPSKQTLTAGRIDRASEKLSKEVANSIRDEVSTSLLVEEGIWSTIYDYANSDRTPYKTQLGKIKDKIGSNLSDKVRKQIEKIKSEDHFLDEIREINEIEHEGYVYDLYVPDSHNFVAGGVFVHNCIDEFDKMDSKDRESLHEAMSNLSVSIAKAGNVATLNARTSVVAAANPKLGRYVKDRDLSENIDLPPTILSRFDLIFLMLDVPNEERDRKVATHVLDIHTRDKRPTPAFDREFFKKYILYARKNISPTLTSEARDRILDFYVEIRRSQDQTVPITMRQLESLVRIAEAHSKMLLREKATKESAEFAIDLMKNSLFQVARGGEGVDIDKVVAGTSTEERSRYMIVVDIIKERGEEYEEGGVPFEVIVEDAREKGIREGFVREVIKREKKRGSIYTPKENHYKVIPKGGP